MFYKKYIKLATNFNKLDLTQEDKNSVLEFIESILLNNSLSFTVINNYFDIMYEVNGCLHLSFQTTDNEDINGICDFYEKEIEALFSSSMSYKNIQFEINLEESNFIVRTDLELLFNSTLQTGLIQSLNELPKGTTELYFIGDFPDCPNLLVHIELEFKDSKGNILTKPDWYNDFCSLYTKTFRYEEHDGLKLLTLKNLLFGTIPIQEVDNAIENKTLLFNTYGLESELKFHSKKYKHYLEAKLFLD